MPGFDRSGPAGTGPMTGGARGYCNPAANYTDRQILGPAGFGRGMACGRGFRGGYGRPGRDARRDFGRSVLSPSVPEKNDMKELQELKQQTDALRKSLDAIIKKANDCEDE